MMIMMIPSFTMNKCNNNNNNNLHNNSDDNNNDHYYHRQQQLIIIHEIQQEEDKQHNHYRHHYQQQESEQQQEKEMTMVIDQQQHRHKDHQYQKQPQRSQPQQQHQERCLLSLSRRQRLLMNHNRTSASTTYPRHHYQSDQYNASRRIRIPLPFQRQQLIQKQGIKWYCRTGTKVTIRDSLFVVMLSLLSIKMTTIKTTIKTTDYDDDAENKSNTDDDDNREGSLFTLSKTSSLRQSSLPYIEASLLKQSVSVLKRTDDNNYNKKQSIIVTKERSPQQVSEAFVNLEANKMTLLCTAAVCTHISSPIVFVGKLLAELISPSAMATLLLLSAAAAAAAIGFLMSLSIYDILVLAVIVLLLLFIIITTNILKAFVCDARESSLASRSRQRQRRHCLLLSRHSLLLFLSSPSMFFSFSSSFTLLSSSSFQQKQNMMKGTALMMIKKTNNNNNDDNKRNWTLKNVAFQTGEIALRQVQWLGSRVATSDMIQEHMDDETRINKRYHNDDARYIMSKESKKYMKSDNDEESIVLSNSIYGYEAAKRILQRSNIFNNNNNNNNKNKNKNKKDNNKIAGNGGSSFSIIKSELFENDDNDDDNEEENDDEMDNNKKEELFATSSSSSTTSIRSRQVSYGESVLKPMDYSINNNQMISSTFTRNSNNYNKKASVTTKERQVWEALSNLEADMQLLDRLAGQKPQLSVIEITLLTAAVATCVSGPIVLDGKLAEFIAPSMAAISAAIGIGAEYTGKVAVADGKEVAAASIQCAAEAEIYVANAERSKAIIPLCVGIGATAATLALLVPVLLDALVDLMSLSFNSNFVLATELYLCCPLIGVLSASVAGLSYQETKSYCNLAIGVGNRRFARRGLVGRTWLSSTELIERKSKDSTTKWKTFIFNVLPAPIIGLIIPGTLPTKTIIVAAVAAAQSAYFLTQCEYILARAIDAVALKARSAAICDTYANQGARSAAILPFTSALSGLCAAATAAIVELPFIEQLASISPRTPISILSQIIIISTLPALSALFAAAASVSKARCEVDAEAAMQAASTMAFQYDSKSNNDKNDKKNNKKKNNNDPILEPVTGVWELIKLTFNTSIREPIKEFFITKLIFQFRYNVRNMIRRLSLLPRSFNRRSNNNNK